MKDLIILIPVYNDWECLQLLCAHKVFKEMKPESFELVIVNDGSFQNTFNKENYPFPIDIIDLHANIGHQKAIAIGLSYIYHHKEANNVIVMDADGEDNPEHILTLLKASEEKQTIISAKRVHRKEPLTFQIGYKIYKVLFRILTGKPISFGNFVLIPGKELNRLIYKNDIWNHLAAGIIKSNIPISIVPIERSRRLTGVSKMNFNGLLLHGLGAIVVFIERVSTRLLIMSILLLFFTGISIATIVGIRLFTELAIPGWASTLTSAMFIIFLQSFLLTLFTLFLYLASQSQRQLIPGIHYKGFVANTLDHDK